MARDHQQVDGRRGRASKRTARWAWLTAAALVLAGCATVPSNTPDDYGQVTEDNYLSACEESDEERSDCQCFYDGIVDEVPFDQFKDFEQQVEDDPTDVPAPYTSIVESCAPGTVGPVAEPDDATTTTLEPS